MKDRFFAVVAVVTGMVVLALAPLWAGSPQTDAAAAVWPASPKNYVAPKTPWGDPDLQGEWTGQTTTPLQKPAEGRTVITDPVELARQYDLDPEENGRGVGTYNAFWREYGLPVPGQTSLVIDPPDGKIPALTPEAEARVRAAAGQRNADGSAKPPAGPEERAAHERCLSWDLVVGGAVSTWYRVVQTPGYVAINQYRMHDMRLIPLDGSPHVASSARSWAGDSRGHWEGATLVVDTTNFNGKADSHGILRGAGMNLHVIERYTRIGPDLIDYTATMEDPAVWTKPWTIRVPLRRDTEGFYEYGCHEGNQSLVGILSGARADERKAAGGSK